jgi:hypothetical protein
VVTPELEAEYNKHVNYPNPRFAEFGTSWRTDMQRAGRIIRPKNDVVDNDLREAIRLSSNRDLGKLDIMLKDMLLIEAALAPESDKTIVSQESKVRNAFAENCREIEKLKALVWVNPAKAEENAIEWLKNGAKAEEGRYLESFKPTPKPKNKPTNKVQE